MHLYKLHISLYEVAVPLLNQNYLMARRTFHLETSRYPAMHYAPDSGTQSYEIDRRHLLIIHYNKVLTMSVKDAHSVQAALRMIMLGSLSELRPLWILWLEDPPECRSEREIPVVPTACARHFVVTWKILQAHGESPFRGPCGERHRTDVRRDLPENSPCPLSAAEVSLH